MQRALRPTAPHAGRTGQNTVVMRRLSTLKDVPAVLPDVLTLVHEAGNPYFDWLFGSREHANSTIADWMRRPTSELSIDRIWIALVDGELVGMYLGLAGAAVRECRQADAVALLAETGRSRAARDALVERVRASKDLFPPVGPGDFYLSKIGVVTERRGEGLGRAITSEFLAAGRENGFHRFRLDVAADNEHAIRLYRSLGFVSASEHEAAGLRYLSMTAKSGTASPGPPTEAA